MLLVVVGGWRADEIVGDMLMLGSGMLVVVAGPRVDEVGDMLMLGSGMLVVKVGVRCSESIDISSAMLELHSS